MNKLNVYKWGQCSQVMSRHAVLSKFKDIEQLQLAAIWADGVPPDSLKVKHMTQREADVLSDEHKWLANSFPNP